MSLSEVVVEQIKSLPEDMTREVLDFIGYLRERQDRAEWQDLVQAQGVAMKSVWDNPEDEVWNEL